MAISPSRALIKYIEDGIDKNEYKWVYRDVYEKSLLSLIVSVKNRARYSIKSLNNIDNIFTKMRPFYSFICLDFIRRLSEYNKLNSLIEYDDSKGSTIDLCLKQSYSSLLTKVKNQLGEDQHLIYTNAIKLLGKEAHSFCWHFFVIAKANNLIEKLVEEHYLVMEIDLFLKLKE
jgi:hypothetical protein